MGEEADVGHGEAAEVEHGEKWNGKLRRVSSGDVLGFSTSKWGKGSKRGNMVFEKFGSPLCNIVPKMWYPTLGPTWR